MIVCVCIARFVVSQIGKSIRLSHIRQTRTAPSPRFHVPEPSVDTEYPSVNMFTVY